MGSRFYWKISDSDLGLSRPSESDLRAAISMPLERSRNNKASGNCATPTARKWVNIHPNSERFAMARHTTNAEKTLYRVGGLPHDAGCGKSKTNQGAAQLRPLIARINWCFPRCVQHPFTHVGMRLSAPRDCLSGLKHHCGSAVGQMLPCLAALHLCTLFNV